MELNLKSCRKGLANWSHRVGDCSWGDHAQAEEAETQTMPVSLGEH